MEENWVHPLGTAMTVPEIRSSPSLMSEPENQSECVSLQASFRGVSGEGPSARPHPATLMGLGKGFSDLRLGSVTQKLAQADTHCSLSDLVGISPQWFRFIFE